MVRRLRSYNLSTNDKPRRIKLVVQYDGTDFCGWAEQPDVRTVQGTIKECIYRATKQQVELRGASRTDSGAHALGQVADFETTLPIEPSKWPAILNPLLDVDVRIARATVVPLRFHSRFFAKSRTYLYRLSEELRVDPMRSRYVHACGRNLNVSAMQEAAQAFVGERDMRAFGEELNGVENCVRKIFRVDVSRVRDEVRIEIEAAAFIRGMARRMAGALLEVGLGSRSGDSLKSLLEPELREGKQWPVVLPAKGLTLLRVKYGPALADVRVEG